MSSWCKRCGERTADHKFAHTYGEVRKFGRRVSGRGGKYCLKCCKRHECMRIKGVING